MKPIKKIIIPVVAAALILVTMQNCSKGGGGNGGCNETAMSITTVPANNSTEPISVGPDFTVQVNITANKPTAGVTIEVKAHPVGSTTNFYTSGVVNSTNSNNSFTITGTPATVACKVDIIVTSKSCATNKFTGGYEYSMK